MTGWTYRLLLLLALTAMSCSAEAARLALVIGNDTYTSVPKLQNGRNDARAIARELSSAGFVVVNVAGDGQPYLDVDRKSLFKAVDSLRLRVKKGDEVVVFFSGHGAQIGSTPYLLPVDIQAESDKEVMRNALPLDEVMDEIKTARFSLLIIDACRDNPFPKTGTKTIGDTRGLAPIEPAEGVAIILAASRGQKALDRLGNEDKVQNGLFTRELLRRMREPGVNVTDMLKQVRDGVEQQAAKVNHRQRPALQDESRGSFCFYNGAQGCGNMTPPVGDSTIDAQSAARARDEEAKRIEDNTWAETIRLNTLVAYEAYKAGYPQGRYVASANVAMARLRTTEPPSAPVNSLSSNKPNTMISGQIFKDCAGCPEMVVIPAGSFMQGSPKSEAGRDDSEGPQHAVTLMQFAMGKTEVTVGQFRGFVSATSYMSDAETSADEKTGCKVWPTSNDGGLDWQAGRNWRNPGWNVKENEPVVCVSHNDARAYIHWLSSSTGKGYQLPSESQWEYAARGGTNTSRYWGDTASNACAYANVLDQTLGPDGGKWETPHPCKDGYFFVAPVGSYRANAFGLHDMIGNVWEWTEDCWHPSYESGGPTDGSSWTSGYYCALKVVRGGSWIDEQDRSRAAKRFVGKTADRSVVFGFRLARTLP